MKKNHNNNLFDKREKINNIISVLNQYDVVSFDVFDTLVLRAFTKPEDLFRILSSKYNMVDFYSVRKKAQKNARKKSKKNHGHTEITIEEIYKEVQLQTNIKVEVGVQNEFNLEMDLCLPNPYMKEVYDKLIELGKKVIIISDMYLPKPMMEKILINCGYRDYEKLYVSCEYNASKSVGDLFKIVEEDIGTNNIIHIGDNIKSDIENAKKHGWSSYYYKKTSEMKNEVDLFDMSSTIGSYYKAIVKNNINNKNKIYPFDNVYYYYGYVYSGIMVLGYVNWIYQYAKTNKIDKILFLSRDGYILNEVFNQIYGDIPSEYVLWSRHATLKISPEKDLERFIWQFFTRIFKNNKRIVLKDILLSMNLIFLEEELNLRNISKYDIVDDKIKKVLINLIKDNIDKVIENSQELKEAARQYYKEKVEGNKRICIVDIGYRGSGAIALKNLFESEWKFDCEVKTLIAFGLSKTNAFDDVLNLDKSVNSYVFSEMINTDLSLKFQEKQLMNTAAIDILIAAAPKPSFLYFKFDDSGKIQEIFEEEEEDYMIVNGIHKGIFEFIKDYKKIAIKYPFLMNISGRDAYAPLLYLFQEHRYKRFVNDLVKTPYSLLISGVNYNKTKTLSDTYRLYNKDKHLKKIKFTINSFKKKIRKRKIIKIILKVRKICKKTNKKLKKNLKNKIFFARFYYTSYYKRLKVKNNVILLQSYAGDNFFGNPYYIFQEIYNRYNKKEFKFYIGVKKEVRVEVENFIKTNGFKNIKLINLHSRKYCKILATAKYLINNVSFPVYFIKKDSQIYINTWHGTPLKGLGRSIKDAPHESGNYSRNFLMTDYFVLPNKYTFEIMKKDYMINQHFKGEYILAGYPRNSIFFNHKSRDEIRKKLELDDKKVVVYMPTWRRANSKKTFEEKYPEIVKLLKELNSNLEENTVVYIKLHNMMREIIDMKKFPNIREFPKEYETYEFLNIADCLITDYSSVMFDFANTNKKIILFVYDIEEYIKGRTIYFPIEKLPFNITRKVNKVIDYIKVEDDANNEQLKEFRKKFCDFDNINATHYILEYIFNSKINNLEVLRTEKLNNNNTLIYLGDFKDNETNQELLQVLEKLDNNIMLTFPMKKVSKNRWFINKIPKNIDYITMQGNINITIIEGVCLFLKEKLGISNKWIEKQIKFIFSREIKRLFPNIEFKVVMDLVGDNNYIIYMLKEFESKKYLVLNQTFLVPSLHKKYKSILNEYYKDFDMVSTLKNINVNECFLEVNLYPINEKFKFKNTSVKKIYLDQNNKE